MGGDARGKADVGYSWECMRGTLSPGWAPEIREVEKSRVIKRKVKLVAGARCALTHPCDGWFST